MKTKIGFALVLLLAASGCERGIEVETRTFQLQHIDGSEAGDLVMPYVNDMREDIGSRGVYSYTASAITVRETPDNLDRIEQMLAELDRPRPDVRLHFQLIEADGFATTDPAIADVVAELRKIFRFGGYRLAGEAFVTATDRSRVEQRLRASDEDYFIQGNLYRLAPGSVRLEEITLATRSAPLLQTTVNVRPGQTLVLGSSPKAGTTTTLLLTVRAEEVDAGS